MFNSKEYSWANVRVFMLGKPIVGVRSISYTVNQDKSLIYGMGAKPRAIQRGNISYAGSLTLLQNELEALIRVAPNKSLMELSFDLVVSYTPTDDNNSALVVDVLQHCEFTQLPKEISQNDKMMEITLPLLFLGIKNQA